MTAPTWYHGVTARWWAEFNTSGPEIGYFRKWVIHFTARTVVSKGFRHSRSVVVRQGRSSGGNASDPGRERAPRTPVGVTALGCGLATICR